MTTGASAVLAGAFLFVAVNPTLAEPPQLRFPVDCTLGEDCFIQQFPDRDPGPGATDFTCGPMAYDGHKGTDIRLIDDAAIEKGVDVIAASPGWVRGVRDGEPDIRQGKGGAPNVQGRECGNGVLVEDDSGWQVQYCHLRRGSIRVRPGQDVETGDVLGQIGLSGRTEFPHVHITVRNPAGTVIDPFDARPQNASCTFKDRRSLWAETERIGYVAGGALQAGLLDRVPEYSEVRAGLPNSPELSVASPALVVWGHFFAPHKGDVIRLTLLDPDNQTIVSRSFVMVKDRATQFHAAGKRARGAWPAGTYTGVAELLRFGSVIDSLRRTIDLR